MFVIYGLVSIWMCGCNVCAVSVQFSEFSLVFGICVIPLRLKIQLCAVCHHDFRKRYLYRLQLELPGY